LSVPQRGRAIPVLVVEDDARLRDILTRHLERMGYEVRAASSGGGALSDLEQRPASIVLTDVRMPGMDGHTLLQVLRERCPSTKVILMTAFGSVDDAVSAMSAGAYSYVCKPFKVDEIAVVLRNATRELDLEAEVESLARVVRGRFGVDSIIGPSDAMREVRRQLREAISLSAPVLITGRSGTGKEMAARAIHFDGPRKAGAFVPVNCAAIPETLFESEMFGHVRGAFTGADRARTGLIEQTDGGTLFLDEVGEMPLVQQAKFLRVLDDGVVRPLGGRRATRVDLRVVAATNRSLEAMVRQGEFREDLYFRLAVITVHIPELGERPEDVPPLAEHLLLSLAATNGLPAHGFSDEALQQLSRHPWAGNVRELRNVVERAMIRSRGRRIAVENLGLGPGPTVAPAHAAEPQADLRSMQDVEKEHIAGVLAACAWNRSEAARVLGIDRRTLFSKIQRYGLVGPMR